MSRKKNEREEYVEASIAAREMQARLIEVSDDLAKVDFKVASAVNVFTSSFSKVWDEVSREQIAAVADCHPQVAGRSLTRLHRLGVLTWEPSKHAGGQSRLSLLPPDTTVVSGEDAEDDSPDTTVVSSPDTAVVSLPRSSSEKKDLVGPHQSPTTSTTTTSVDEEDPGWLEDDELEAWMLEHDRETLLSLDSWCAAKQLATEMGLYDEMTRSEFCAVTDAMDKVPYGHREAVMVRAWQQDPSPVVKNPAGYLIRRIQRAVTQLRIKDEVSA